MTMPDPDADARRNYERRVFGYDPQANDLLNRHLARTGASKTVLTDMMAAFQVGMLRNLLSVVEAALADEQVEPLIARRVIEKVIYGGSPSPTDAEERARTAIRMTELIQRPSLLVIPPDRGRT